MATEVRENKKPLKNVRIATCKMFDLDDSQVHVIAISSKEVFGKADTILVSKDRETWVQHSYKDFMDAVNNAKPIKVA